MLLKSVKKSVRKEIMYSSDDSTGKIEDSSDVEDNSYNLKDENMKMDDNDDSDNDEFASQDSKIKLNSEWANAMAKILSTNKPKRKKTLVLAKARKLKPADDNEVNEIIPSFELERGENPPKIETKNDLNIKSEETKKSSRLEMARRIRKKSLEAKGRKKPSVLDKDREKVLAKIATKGVVQLFNAVRQQQRSLEKEIQNVGPSDVKQEKILKSVDKRAFLDVLMGAKSQTVPEVKKEESKVNCEWSVLRDDFMMSTRLKDWDKKDNELKEGND
ncbi:RRP15-like protein [Lycorma delicatula]|uniref:RRP15-like protein n=1 Tax=Lycorma delicatula TaxID=130591 RepID=UPI003F510E60